MIQWVLEKGDCMRFVVIDRQDANSKRVSQQIKEKCIAHDWILDEKKPDILFSVGGDGTLLRAIHSYVDRLDSMSFVGIHTGTLGFLTDYTQEELDTFLLDVFKQQPEIEEFPMLEITLPQDKQTYYAFNDARIASLDRTISLDVYIDGELFERTTGSGICISTQYGSTAINRALSGAVVDPGLQVLQLTEIMPVTHKHHHSLGNPYIMKEDRKILVEGKDLHLAYLSYDHLNIELEKIHQIQIGTSTKKVRFARYRTYSYLKRLKNLY